MKILAIDPGPTESGWIQYDTQSGPEKWGLWPNDRLLIELHALAVTVDELAIEMVQHFGTGMPAGTAVFWTCIWIGRFWGAWGREPALITNPTIRIQLCRSAKASQSNIRQALIDRFGGEDKAIGGVRCNQCNGKGWSGRGRPTCPKCNGGKWRHPPGPLHGITGHVWSALAVAVCWQDMQDQAHRALRPPPWSKPG